MTAFRRLTRHLARRLDRVLVLVELLRGWLRAGDGRFRLLFAELDEDRLPDFLDRVAAAERRSLRACGRVPAGYHGLAAEDGRARERYDSVRCVLRRLQEGGVLAAGVLQERADRGIDPGLSAPAVGRTVGASDLGGAGGQQLERRW